MRLPRFVPMLALAAVTLGTCGLFDTAKKLGASPEGPGLRIHFVPCPGEAVTRVAMLTNIGDGIRTTTGSDDPSDPEEDEIVEWSVAAPAGSDLTEFDVGSVPPGFVEEVSLSEPVASYTSIAIFVGYRTGDGLATVEIGFDTEDMEAGKIYSVDGAVDPSVFRRDGTVTCE